MKNRAVIQLVAALFAADWMRPFTLALGKLNEIGNRLRRLFLKQTADDRTFTRIKNRVSPSRTRHIHSLFAANFWISFRVEAPGFSPVNKWSDDEALAPALLL